MKIGPCSAWLFDCDGVILDSNGEDDRLLRAGEAVR